MLNSNKRSVVLDLKTDAGRQAVDGRNRRVGIATLYRRFGTREELIKAVAEHVFAAEIASAIVEDGADLWEDLVATLTATIDAFAAHPVLTSLAKEHAVMGMDTMAAYAAAKERVLGSCPRRGNGAPGPDR